MGKMILCDDGHTEVCYDRGICPVCEKIYEIKDLINKIADLEKKIYKLRNEEGENESD